MVFWGFKSKCGDPDLWIRPATQNNVTLVYEYVLLYTDDCLVVSKKSDSILKEDIVSYFQLKPYLIGPPILYIGGHIQEVILDTVIKAWDFGYTHYVQSAVNNVEQYFRQKGKSLNAKGLDVLPKKYRSEIYISEELEAHKASYFQYLIGILNGCFNWGELIYVLIKV